jgi:hypothetical protein
MSAETWETVQMALWGTVLAVLAGPAAGAAGLAQPVALVDRAARAAADGHPALVNELVVA